MTIRYQDNPKVTSKGDRNAAAAGFKPSDPRNGKQPASLAKDDLPGSIAPRAGASRGVNGRQSANTPADLKGVRHPNIGKVGLGSIFPSMSAPKIIRPRAGK